MAVGTYKLPICDGCKLPWLPVGWTQDSDPRHPEKPLRCGKCKSIGWDREFVKQQKIAVDVVQPMELNVDPAAEISGGPVHEYEISINEAKRKYPGVDIPRDARFEEAMARCDKFEEEIVKPFLEAGIERAAAINRTRCKHRMTDCPICHPKEAA